MNKQVATTPAQDDPIASIPAIMEMAERYKMAPKAFVYTFRTVAMPQPHSDAEFVSCCLVAHAHGLNPLTKELYFMKTKGGGIQAIVSVDGWAKKCNEHPEFDGMEFVDVHDDKGSLISTTCIIYRKDRKHPVKVTEYLDECEKGGPVWKTHPRRMLRHRALTQAARYAFGFAGIMDYDEFDQWQAMPKAAAISVTSDVPEIPEIPDDVPELPPDDETSGLDDPAGDDMLRPDQEEAALANLKDELAEATPGTRMEIVDMYESVIERMSKAGKDRADAIIEGREK
jgi:phage recombination protein Bet